MMPGVPGSEATTPSPQKKRGEKGSSSALKPPQPPPEEEEAKEAERAPTLKRVATILADKIMGAKDEEHNERKAKGQSLVKPGRRGPR